MCAKFRKIKTKSEEGDRFLRKLANWQKWVTTFVGINLGNKCAKVEKIWKKMEGGDGFLRKS